MKNIHVLPTQNNKSKLAVYHYSDSKNIKIGELGLQLNNTGGWTNCWSEKELYITNDKEVKDWYIYENKLLHTSTNHSKYEILYGKPIVFTTDEDLIKDGVQAIDDEFLEWFAKNPSCEEVEVEKFSYDGTKSIDKYWGGEYKIVIPKEEPKITNCGNNNCQSGVINGINPKICRKCNPKEAQERSYSEKEVLNILDIMLSEYRESLNNKTDFYPALRFEQFKKQVK